MLSKVGGLPVKQNQGRKSKVDLPSTQVTCMQC